MCPGNLPGDGLCSSPSVGRVFGTCHVNVVEGYPHPGVHGLLLAYRSLWEPSFWSAGWPTALIQCLM